MGVRLQWPSWPPGDLGARCWNTVKENYYLGFTSFGGPPVHFKIFHDKFVLKRQWIDEQVYQELFSVCQAFSGPGSTKMHYCINLLHDGFLPAVLGFLLWSLPGALGMYGLAVGVASVRQSLPPAVYALLSGLDAATVGIIALAAVQLAEKAITDRLTRALVFLGGAAGMLYSALWYFPVLMLAAGLAAVVFDYRWLHGPARTVRDVVTLKKVRRSRASSREEEGGSAQAMAAEGTELRNLPARNLPADTSNPTAAPAANTRDPTSASAADEPRVIPAERRLPMSWRAGLLVIALFLVSFVVVVVLRGVEKTTRPLLYRLFANMYLAGTIIFGGGPVVIPLLREYVVAEGWVSPRDFLLGLALIQAFPGPNFNFAVYLGALTAVGAGYSAGAGAVLGYVGIFAPGLVTVHGTMGVWGALRGLRWMRSALRGVNAAAVGLIFTAVYRLWQIGWIDEAFQQGASLANDPWWVVVTAASYVGGGWFGVRPPAAIVLGAVLGLVRYGVVSA